jgi:hypothetical protein
MGPHNVMVLTEFFPPTTVFNPTRKWDSGLHKLREILHQLRDCRNICKNLTLKVTVFPKFPPPPSANIGRGALNPVQSCSPEYVQTLTGKDLNSIYFCPCQYCHCNFVMEPNRVSIDFLEGKPGCLTESLTPERNGSEMHDVRGFPFGCMTRLRS